AADAQAPKEPGTMTPPEPRILEVDGVPMAVRIAGDPARPALLLLHGFPASSLSFRNLMRPLARSCFILAPDLPGFGGSEPIDRPSFSRFADHIGALLSKLDIGSFHLYL